MELCGVCESLTYPNTLSLPCCPRVTEGRVTLTVKGAVCVCTVGVGITVVCSVRTFVDIWIADKVSFYLIYSNTNNFKFIMHGNELYIVIVYVAPFYIIHMKHNVRAVQNKLLYNIRCAGFPQMINFSLDCEEIEYLLLVPRWSPRFMLLHWKR